MNVVVARVTAFRTGGLVRPKYVALGVGDSDYVFPVGCRNKNQALGLKKRNAGKAKGQDKSKFFHD
tara:strand:+ start:309 stop:506 length:198 start_codon:yes stop_codon:yes gene_type:complete